MEKMNLDGNLAFLDEHEREQDEALESLPKCDQCGEPIQDDYYFQINGERFCEDCLHKYYKKYI